MLDLAGEYGRSPALRGFATALWSAAPCLFLFVEVPGVAPTNNPAEEPLREPVVVRKIRGSLRSVRSVMAVCALWACIGAWKRRGPDPMAELAKFV